MRYCALLLIWSVFARGQQHPAVDFTKLQATVEINSTTRSLTGEVRYDFLVNAKTDTITIDAINMIFSDIAINGRPAGSKVTSRALKLFSGYRRGKNVLTFRYAASPKQTLYFTGEGDGLQIWTQGQGKYTSHWLPSFDDVNEKLIHELTVIAPQGMKALSNGELKKVEDRGDRKLWHYSMRKPMSSYLAMLAIGKFEQRTGRSKSGIPLEWYLPVGNSEKFEPTYRYSTELFDFLEREIGVSYPWDVYRQVPVKDFLYAGMENTTATIFASDFVVDEIGFNDRNYVNVNAHELAHQWFGNLVTAQSGTHHWLQEGFATYYALLAERQIFGDDYFYWQLHDMATDLQQVAATDTIPVLNAKASSLSFYKKGAWALHALREAVGEKAFRDAVKKYLEKHRYGSVVTDDFLAQIQKVSSFDVKQWKKKWLESSGIPAEEVRALLLKNDFMRAYFDLQQRKFASITEQQVAFDAILDSNVFYPLKEEVVFRMAEWPFEAKSNLIEKALNDKHPKVRQAVARTMQNLPREQFRKFSVLLNDSSYITREIALNMFYGQFPEYRHEVLDATAAQVGLNDKNLRILWLTLALSSPDYRKEEKAGYYDELLLYAGNSFEGNTRQNAVEKLLYLNPNDINALKALSAMLTHHRWQISKYARDTIRNLVRKEAHLTFFRDWMNRVSDAERIQLERLLPTGAK